MKLYDEFFSTSKYFERLIQENDWKKNSTQLRDKVDGEYRFWKRVLSMLPPERRLLKEFEWMTQCYKQILLNLEKEKFNRKIRFIHEGST